MLCNRCINIFRGPCRHGETVPHHYSIGELYQAALVKCYICSKLWHYISPHDPVNANIAVTDYDPFRSKPVSEYKLTHAEHPALESKLEVSVRIDDIITEDSLLSLLKGKEAWHFDFQRVPDAEIQQQRPSTSWDDSLTIAQGWLSGCKSNHQNCSKIASFGEYVPKRDPPESEPPESDTLERFLPKRLLSCDPGYKTVKLVIDPRKDRHPRLYQDGYATISYCWGTVKPFILTSGTENELRNGIEIERLSQVCQDAISVIKGLELSYFWMDSLCIFQDSPEDWADQAPQMSRVYRAGALNIAFSEAEKSRDAYFPVRDLSQLEPCIVGSKWDNCGNANFHIYHHYLWDDAVTSGPLSKRGWVVQELLLPSRILHLTGQQFFWECFELEACETYPLGIPNPSERRKEWKSRKIIGEAFKSANDFERSEVIPDPNAQHKFRQLWAAVVQTFTQRDLTKGTDRLIALAGVAKVMGQAFNDEYLAGLWQNNLAMDLVWSPGFGRDSSDRSQEYRAPSWSWASADCSCKPMTLQEGSTMHPLIENIKPTIKKVNDDAFGVIKEGTTLTMSGWLVTIGLRPSDLSPGWSVQFNGNWASDIFKVKLDRELDPLGLLELYALPTVWEEIGERACIFRCILLRATTDTEEGQFQRVGILKVRKQKWEKWKSEVEAFKIAENEKRIEKYEPRQENGMYRITIS